MELTYRKFYFTDAAAIVAVVNDVRFSRDTIQLPDPYTNDHAIEWIRHSRARIDFLAFAILKNDELVGQVSLTRHNIISGFVGCWIAPDYWGNGAATSAFKKIIGVGFDAGYKEIFGGASDKNLASAKAMMNAGMIKTDTYYDIPFKAGTKSLRKYVIEP